MVKKVSAFFLTVILVAGLLTGCGKKPDPLLGKWMPFTNDLYGYYEFGSDNYMSLTVLGGPEPIVDPGKYSVEVRKGERNILTMTLDRIPDEPHSVAYDFSDNNLVLNLYPLDDLGGEPFKLSKIVSDEEYEAAHDFDNNNGF